MFFYLLFFMQYLKLTFLSCILFYLGFVLHKINCLLFQSLLLFSLSYVFLFICLISLQRKQLHIRPNLKNYFSLHSKNLLNFSLIILFFPHLFFFNLYCYFFFYLLHSFVILLCHKYYIISKLHMNFLILDLIVYMRKVNIFYM